MDLKVDSDPLDRSRAISRLAAQYFLRLLDVIKPLHDGDPMKAIIFTAIWSANVSHLRPNLGFDATDDVPPDEERRPVTISAISQSLGIPFETVRRYVAKLIADGLCVSHGRKGVVVPSAVFAREEMIQGLLLEQRYTQQYYRALGKLL
jgi:hypothetical protein